MGGTIELIQKHLELLLPTFSASAKTCVETMFGKHCEVPDPWEVSEKFQSQFENLLCISAASNTYSTLTYLGIQSEAIIALTGLRIDDPNEAYNTLGEFLNWYLGIIVRNAQFRDAFGPIMQGLPILFSNGQSLIPFLWGVHGYVYFGEQWLYMGFSIRSNESDFF
jgi:hypothetical protein